MKYEVIGKNTELDGKPLEIGDVVEDSRKLDEIWLNKFKKFSKKLTAAQKARPAQTTEDVVEDADDEFHEDGEDPNSEGEQQAAAPAAAKKNAAKKKVEKDAAEETPEYVDVTDQYPDAKRHDLAVFEYPNGEFQIFDADDKDNLEAVPVNTTPIKTKKKLEEFLKSH